MEEKRIHINYKGDSVPLYPPLPDDYRKKNLSTIRRYVNLNGASLRDAERIISLRLDIKKLKESIYRSEQCDNTYYISGRAREDTIILSARKKALDSLEQKYRLGKYTQVV